MPPIAPIQNRCRRPGALAFAPVLPVTLIRATLIRATLFRATFFRATLIWATLIWATLIWASLFSASLVWAATDEASPPEGQESVQAALAAGRELAQQLYDRPRGEDASSRVVMLLQREGKPPRRRTLYNFARDRGDAERWTLLRFIEPEDVEDTGLLTLDFKGEESDQWLYLPALDRVRRISSERRGGRFVGSDFFYEDLRDREVDLDHHRLTGRENLGNIECLVLESIPVEADNSVYSKRVSWIHPELLLPLRVEFYQRGAEQPGKRLQAKQIRQVEGYWTIFESTMHDLKSGHQTTLLIEKIDYDQGLPDTLFTQMGLADANREKPYRP